MEINRTNPQFINTAQGKAKQPSVSAFGADHVSIRGEKQMNLINPSQIKKLFEAGTAKWSITPADGLKGILSAKDGSLYIGNGGIFESKLTKIDGNTGKTLWEKKFNKELDSYPAVESPNGDIFICTTDCIMRALDPKDGSVKWDFNMAIRGGDPSFAKDGTVFAQYDDDLFVMKPNGGKKFRYRVNDYMHSVVHVDDKGAALLQLKDKGIAAVSPSGKEMWLAPGTSVKYYETEPRHVFTLSDKTLTARDKMSGKVLWEKPFEGYSVEGAVKGKVFIEKYEKIACLDTADGSTKWEKDEPGGALVRHVGDDGTIYTGGNEKIEALDPDTGNVKWSIKTSEDATYGNVKMGSKGILFINDKRNVYGLDVNDGRVKFKFSSPNGVASFQVNPSDDMVYVRDERTNTINAVEVPDPKKIAEELNNSIDAELEGGNNPEAGIEVGEKFVDIGGVRLERKKK